MTQITIELPDEEALAFIALLQARGYGFTQSLDHGPDWHQRIVEQRLADAKPEDYQPWVQAYERLKNRKAR